MKSVPETALQFGFENELVGSHTSRTIMLPELQALLDYCPADARFADYQHAVIEDNVLSKGTQSTRQRSFRQLRELYGLDTDVLIFRALRDLWDGDEEAQPLIACLCAAARDPLLRVTADWAVESPPGSEINTAGIEGLIERAFPGHYKQSVRAVTARNLIGSLRQSGHVARAPSRKRMRAENRPTATAYALLLAHLCGARGDLLFESFWTHLLDHPGHAIREQAAAASRQGWIEYRHAGGVTEVSFRNLLRDREATR